MTARSPLVLAAVALAACAIGLLVLIRTAADAPPTPAPPPPPRDASPPVARDASVQRVELARDAAAIDPAAGEERDSVLAALRNSGHGDEVWDAQASALIAAIGRGVADTRDEGCFVAGCGATFTFASEAAYRERLDQLPGWDAYRAWTGGKRFTPPERRADGSVVVGLVLYRPD